MTKAGQQTYTHPDFEITALDVASEDNRHTVVTMYSDHTAADKKKPVNDRATALARATGHKTKLIHGDAFVGRAFDNKNQSIWWRLQYVYYVCML